MGKASAGAGGREGGVVGFGGRFISYLSFDRLPSEQNQGNLSH